MSRLGHKLRYLLFGLVVFWVCSCQNANSVPRVDVSFSSPSGTLTPSFSMEVVSTPEQRAKGLMFRKSVGAREGMLFVFPDEQQRSFWMKNTLVPLDMVFVSRDLRVVGFVEHTQPLSEERQSVDGASMYVLEFRAGTLRELGISPGFQVVVTGALPTAAL